MESKWEKIKNAKWEASRESKSLWRAKAPSSQYSKGPYKFKIVWQWSDCYSNQKTIWDEKKALRLFNCIDIGGWPNHLK